MIKNKSRGLSKTSLALLNAPKGVNLRFNKQIITQILRKCQGGLKWSGFTIWRFLDEEKTKIY